MMRLALLPALARPSQLLQPSRLPMLVLVVLLVVGALLRFPSLGEQSFYHDEMDMLLYADGVVERGTASKMVGSIEAPLATYEAVVFPVALSRFIFGESEWAARVPAAIFGVLSIAAIFFVGRALFSTAVGLLAATLLCFSPQALIWSKFLWHPQQALFFALLAAYFAFRATEGEERVRPLVLAVLFFALTYLTWEGTGYLLPSLLIAIVTMRGRDQAWIRQRGVWLAVAAIVMVVGFQLGRRILVSRPFLVVGTGLSDVTSPLPVFLQTVYNPLFYIRNFLLLDNNVLLTLLTLAGIPLCWQLKPYRFFATLLLSDLFLMTNLLPHSAVRYVFHLESFLMLTASASLVQLLRWVRGQLSTGMPPILQGLVRASAVVGCATVLVTSSHWARVYALSDFSQPAGFHVRDDVYYIDFRSAADVLRSQLRPGDVIVSVFPDATQRYASVKSDYFIQLLPRRQMLFDPAQQSPRLVERNVGTPTLTSLEDLQEVANHAPRVWIMAVPYSLLYYYGGRTTREWVARNAKVVHESYDARLYLLEH